jgi:hypothetical protein
MMQKDLYNLITGDDEVNICDFIDNSRIIIVNFDDKCPFTCCDADKSFTYMMIHAIDMRSLEIVTYKKRTQTMNTIIQNNSYCNNMTISKCRGHKCREFGPEELCLSCYPADNLSFYEVLNLFEDAKVVGEMLIIYTEEDYDKVFNNVLNIFTQTYVCHSRYEPEDPELVNIGENNKIKLIDNVYSTFLKSCLRNYLDELKIGSDPNELPIPTTLLNKN